MSSHISAATFATLDGDTVDLIAVERFLDGKPVDLAPEDRAAVVWVLHVAGLGAGAIAARVRSHRRYVKKVLEGPQLLDAGGHPLFPQPNQTSEAS